MGFDGGRKSGGKNSVLCFEELLEIFGENCCEFLPGEKFEAGGEGGAVDGRENGIPGFDEIVAACVAEDAK